MTISFIIFMLSMAANQVLMARAQRALSTEQKALASDALSSQRPWFFLVLAASYGIWVFAVESMSHIRWSLPAFMILVFAHGLGHSIFQLRRLSRFGLPTPYIRAAWISLAITQVGIVTLFGFMLYNFFPLLHS